MQSREFPLRLVGAAVLALAFLGTANFAVAQQFQLLYSFTTYNSSPFGGVIFDAAGNMYGTTADGGTYANGTVYELSPQVGGGWTQTILHSFDSLDGYEPYAGLAMDSAGNLYGTTRFGGSENQGTLFEVTPAGDGTWTETVLHNFGSTTTDGLQPYSTPYLDSAGNIYGTTIGGGTYRNGTVFELEHIGTRWQEKVLFSFNPGTTGVGGFWPYAGVIMDSAGNLYGTTEACQCSYTNQGTVFELKRTGSAYSERVLHYFYSHTSDGSDPMASLTFDNKGNLYGTTASGGTGAGTVFELSPTSSGQWKEKILHNFTGNPDGSGPMANVIFDTHGNLYGTTVGGGTQNWGTVFELKPAGNGTWTETILYNFKDDGDGDDISSPVTLDALGNIYGTALGSGAYDGGDVFEIAP